MKGPNPNPRFIKYTEQLESYHIASSQEPPVTKDLKGSKAKAPSVTHRTHHLTVYLGTFAPPVQPKPGEWEDDQKRTGFSPSSVPMKCLKTKQLRI